MDPLRASDDAYRSATEYVAALPPELEGRALTLQRAFRHKAAQIPSLTGPRVVQETAYLQGKLVGIALQIGYLAGDLERDWRN